MWKAKKKAAGRRKCRAAFFDEPVETGSHEEGLALSGAVETPPHKERKIRQIGQIRPIGRIKPDR